MVEQTKEELAKLKAENDALEAEIKRKDKLNADAALAGVAGIRPPMPEKKPMTNREYAKVLSTGKVPKED